MKEGIKRALHSVLKENAFERKRESVSWEINTNKVAMAKVSKSIFIEKVPNTGKKYTAELLVDASGSMWRDMEKAIKVAKEIVSYFLGVIDLKITFFNVLEYKFQNREVLKMKEWFDELEDYCSSFEEDWKIEFRKWEWGKDWRESWLWNWEVCNLVTAFENIQKEWDSEKIIIMIWDGSLAIDYINEERLIEKNYYIAWQPISKYNEETYKSTVNRILSQGVKILPIELWGDFYKKYFPETFRVNRVEDTWEVVLKWLNKEFGRKNIG